MGFTTKNAPFAICGDKGDRDVEIHRFVPSLSPLSPLPPHREFYTFKITLFSYSWILQSYPQGQRHFYGDKDIGYFGGKSMGTKTLVYGDKDIFMGTKTLRLVSVVLGMSMNMGCLQFMGTAGTKTLEVG